MAVDNKMQNGEEEWGAREGYIVTLCAHTVWPGSSRARRREEMLGDASPSGRRRGTKKKEVHMPIQRERENKRGETRRSYMR